MSTQAVNPKDILSSSEDDFLDYALQQGFGDLHFKVDPATGMKAIIAIHNTKLGPALGGCRFIEYPNTASAIQDAMRLAKGMSYKAASVNLPLGGGKSVIIKPHDADFDREGYFHAFGRFIQELNGRYITALDSGSLLADMDIIGQHTSYVASLTSLQGDPSPFTARGVFEGIKCCVAFKLGKDNLRGLHVAIQGLGHVGYFLAELLHAEGVKLTVADIDRDHTDNAVKNFGAQVVSTQEIHAVTCDVYSPCALGAAINSMTVPQLNTPIVAGAANNQLAHQSHGEMLYNRGILYAPDYVINSGGLIFAASKYLKIPDNEMNEKIGHIGLSLQEIFQLAERNKQPPSDVADQLAQEKLA